MTLRPLATSCTKDYKGHSRVQTSFTEPPNISCLFWMRLADLWDRWLNRSSYQLFILPLLQRLLFPRKSEQPSLPHQSHNVYWYLSACTLHPQNDDDQIKGGKKNQKKSVSVPCLLWLHCWGLSSSDNSLSLNSISLLSCAAKRSLNTLSFSDVISLPRDQGVPSLCQAGSHRIIEQLTDTIWRHFSPTFRMPSLRPFEYVPLSVLDFVSSRCVSRYFLHYCWNDWR